jgi:hypothetical protein
MRPCRPDVASIAPETVIIGTPAFIALLEAAVAQLRNKVPLLALLLLRPDLDLPADDRGCKLRLG